MRLTLVRCQSYLTFNVWAGAGPLLSGLFMIVLQRLLARRWASQASRPAATAFGEKSIVVQILSILAVYGFFGARL